MRSIVCRECSRAVLPALILAVGALVLGSCAPTTTVEVVPQVEAGIRVVQIPLNVQGDLVVEGPGGQPFSVPPGHFPPRGQCRIWQPGVPPGRQSPPGACDDLVLRVPPDAVLLRY